MKQSSIILNAIIIIAIIPLYVFFFSSKKNPSHNQAEAVKFDSASAAKMSMVYLDIDSLILNYTMAKELNEQLTNKQKASKANLEAKAASFQKEAEAFQEKVQRNAFVSQQSAEAQQQELMMKQQGLQQLEYDLTAQLASEQQKLNKQVYDSITNYLKEYNKPYNYQFILGHSTGGGILLANESLNITKSVLDALNARYAAAKK